MDPNWLYAHWDFTQEQLQSANTQANAGSLTLRVFEESIRGRIAFETHVHPESLRWYVHVDTPGCDYVAQLGYYNDHWQWTALASSLVAHTPSNQASTKETFQLATLTQTGSMQVHSEEEPSADKWTPAQEFALEELVLTGMTQNEAPSSKQLQERKWRRSAPQFTFQRLSSLGLNTSSIGFAKDRRSTDPTVQKAGTGAYYP